MHLLLILLPKLYFLAPAANQHDLRRMSKTASCIRKTLVADDQNLCCVLQLLLEPASWLDEVPPLAQRNSSPRQRRFPNGS